MPITAASLVVKVGADTSQAQHALAQVGQSVDNTARRVQTFRRDWDNALGGIGQGLAAGFAGGLGFGAVTQGLGTMTGMLRSAAGDIASTYMEYERLNMSLKAMSAQELVNAGSATTFAEGLAMSGERAKELLEWTRELAIASPYNTQDVAGVMRLGMVYGFNSEQAKRSTKAVTDYGAALGLTGPEMERVIRALGQMNQRGKISSQELNQLSEVGVGGLKILADAAGVSTTEFQKLIEQGLVPAGPAIEAIIQAFEKTEGAAAANAGTLGGLVSSMEDIKDIGEVDLFGPAIEAALPALEAVVNEMKTPEFREGLREMGTQLGVLAGQGVTTGAASVADTAGAIKELLDTGAPPWLATLAPLFTGQGGSFDVSGLEGPKLPDVPIKGYIVEAYSDPEKDYGVVINSDGRVTTATVDLQDAATGSGGKLVIDSVAGISDFVWQAEGFGITYDRATGLQMQIADQKVQFVGDWREGTLVQAFTSAQASFTEPIMMTAAWYEYTASTLFTEMQTLFDTPVTITGTWLGDTVSGLWGQVQDFFSSNPIGINLFPQSTERGSEHSGHSNHPRRPSDNSGGWLPPWLPFGAEGFRDFAGGLAVVGEEGPELVRLPGGADVFSNPDSLKMLAALGIPGFADGNAAPPPGAWLGGQSASFGAIGNLIGNAAAKGIDKAGKEFAKNIQKASNEFASALQGVPGLFGTSQVTGQQMKMAELGVPQNFADDYLRRLSDEVINGVDWAGVDIGEAAAAAGIDPNLPAQAILEMFRAAWQDSSLFANPENLKFINTDAVKAQKERQQASEAGQANIMALFGVGDEELVNQIAGLGLQVQTGLSQYLTEQGLGPVGAQVAQGIGAGLEENGGEMGAGVALGFGTWVTSPDGFTATTAMGDSLAGAVNAGFKSSLPNYDWSVPVVPPTGGGTGTPPPGFASGTLSSPSGWALVGENGAELVRLPGGSRVYNDRETSAMSPNVSVVINASVGQPHDVELLARRVARMIQQKRGR